MVLDVVHNLMTFFNDSTNCTCRRPNNKKDIRTCFEKVGFKRFFERHLEIKALGKHEFELFIKTQLMSFEISNEKIEKNETEKKTRHSYKYSFNISLPLCKPAYLKLCNLNDYKLSTLQTHLQENGLTERTHGNTGRVSRRNSRVFVDFNITSSVKEYLTQYGTIHGLPSPMRHLEILYIFQLMKIIRQYIINTKNIIFLNMVKMKILFLIIHFVDFGMN